MKREELDQIVAGTHPALKLGLPEGFDNRMIARSNLIIQLLAQVVINTTDLQPDTGGSMGITDAV